MLDRRRPPEHVSLELAALRIEHELRGNVISRMADELCKKPEERDMLTALLAAHTEVAAYVAGVTAEVLTQH